MQSSDSLIFKSARWRDAALPLPRGMPAQARGWIRLETSMTRALVGRFGPSLRVAVFHDGRGRLQPDEARLLGTRQRRGQVREVLLQVGERWLLAARTVHVARRLRAHAVLATLGKRPLGELLFACGKPLRRQREYAQVSLKPRAGAGRHCWARRTVYLYERQPLLVTEVFLPEMVRRR